jgi:transposase
VPRVNDRRVLNGIFWVLRSGAPWRDLPDNFGPYTTCYNRFVRWRRAGVWGAIMNALAATHDAAVQMIDTSIIRVHQHSAHRVRGEGVSRRATKLRLSRRNAGAIGRRFAIEFPLLSLREVAVPSTTFLWCPAFLLRLDRCQPFASTRAEDISWRAARGNMEAPLELPLEKAPQKAPPSRCASTSFELSRTRRANSRPATGKSLCITFYFPFGPSSNLVRCSTWTRALQAARDGRCWNVRSWRSLPSAPAASALVLAQYGFEVVRVFHRLYASKRLWEPRSQSHGAGIASGNKRLRSIEDAGVPLSRRSLTFPVGSIDCLERSPLARSEQRLRLLLLNVWSICSLCPPLSGTLGSSIA